MQKLLKNREMLLGLIIIGMILGFTTRAPNFANPENLVTIFNDTSILIILALGQMVVILTKSIDLSVAANLAFTGMAVAMLDSAYPGLPLALLVLLVLVMASNGPGSMMGFDYARTENPPTRIGSATGIVNLGGFCNVTILQPQAAASTSGGRMTHEHPTRHIAGFDVCPCNHLLDWVAHNRLGVPYDRDGEAADLVPAPHVDVRPLGEDRAGRVVLRAVEPELTFGRAVEADDHARQRALAAAGRPHESNAFASSQAETDAVHGAHLELE